MPQNKNTKTANSFFPVWVLQREQRQRLPLGHSDAFFRSLYSSISPCHSWGGGDSPTSGHAILSLEYSPDGTLLVAGCENKNFLMFDPLSRRLIRTVHNAHENIVSNVKFLDSRIFATGSVDKTVSLWDTRNLKSRCQTQLRHSGMVGNIEFSRKNDLLITSGSDGIIHIWDKNNWNKTEECSNKILLHDLLRLRLNPDETKMIISTGSGYLLIVHELDLNRFAQDLNDPKLELFEFAYFLQTTYPSFQNWSHFLFQNRCRNRVEMVADFPNAGGLNVISALEIHPQGWSAFSRSTCMESKQEWTCVHDIQERESSKGGAARRQGSVDNGPPCPQQLERVNEVRCGVRRNGGSTSSLGRASVRICVRSSNDCASDLPEVAFSLERGARKRRYGSPAITARARNPRPGPSSAPPDPLELAGLGSNPASSWVQDLSFPPPNPSVGQFNRIIHVRFPRLTHYINEPYCSDWYYDSVGISADGRLVCSPLESGIRLLAFSPECSEQSVSWCGRKQRPLYEVSRYSSPNDSVLCTKFSPRHCLLVSGCINGKLAWYQPVV